MSSLRQKVLDYVGILSNVDDTNNFVFRLSGEPTCFVKYGYEDTPVEAKTHSAVRVFLRWS